MLPELPPEILQMIFAMVDDTKTLYNVLVSSWLFSRLVEPLLYARIRIASISVFAPSSMTMKLKSLVEALEASNGRRASYVRALSFEPATTFASQGPILIDKVLAQTVNLRSLQLFVLSGLSFETHSFQQTPIYNLTTLFIASTSPQLSLGILRFLESQTSLETLHLILHRRFNSMPSFSSTSFPNLKALCVHFPLVLALLCTSARLTRICVTRRDQFSTEATTEVCTDYVRTLVWNSGSIDLRALRCPNLEWLSGHFESMTDVASLHTSHCKLRGVRFANSPPWGLSHDEVVPRLFATIQTLQFVEYCTGRGDSRHRWHRNAAAPTPVRWLCEPGDEWLADWVEDVVDVGR